MNPIELGKAIAEHGISVITAVMLILVVGLVWYLIKRQSKREEKFDIERAKREEKHDKIQEDDRKFHRGLIANDLKSIHAMSVENSKLNTQGMLLQKEMIKDLKGHNGYCREASKKIIESFDAICDKINGKNSKKVNKKNG